MKKLVLLVVIAASACQADTKNLEKKIDEMNKKLDRLAGKPAGRAEPDRAKTYAVPIEGDPFDGPADAKVTLVKAYDYACPYCEKVRPTMDDLRQKYGEQLRVVYKQLVVHPAKAMSGALAFCAAGKQGKHKEMDRLLWDKGFKVGKMDNSDAGPSPEVPGQAPNMQIAGAEKGAEKGGAARAGKCWDQPEGCAIVVGFAQELGLNVDQFKSDMKGACQQQVQADMRVLQGLGVAATPGFFVNGRFLSGAMPIENFEQLIDEELKKADATIQAGTPAGQYYQQMVIDKGLKTLQQPSG